jgi:hypothetical protein
MVNVKIMGRILEVKGSSRAKDSGQGRFFQDPSDFIMYYPITAPYNAKPQLLISRR